MKPSTDPRIGIVLAGTWRLESLLGSGGMATVFAATHTRNGLRVAVKVLTPEHGQKPEIRARFLREGYLANRIQHPGVVRVIDDGTDGEHVYIVMELLQGETLKDIWQKRSRAVPAVEVERFVAAVLEVLVAAHAAGVVHRDLKPDNVFLLDDGSIKLLDFGIARLHEETALAEHATTTGTMLGTPAFMPPEQALGHWDEVDARSDLYAVGATAWLLLTGKLVHHAKTVPELLVAVATRPAPPLRSVAPDAPERLARVIDRALRFARDERWPDARAMLEALRAPDEPVASDARSTARQPEPARQHTIQLDQLLPDEPEAATRLLDLRPSATPAPKPTMVSAGTSSPGSIHPTVPLHGPTSAKAGTVPTVKLDVSAWRVQSAPGSAPGSSPGAPSWPGGAQTTITDVGYGTGGHSASRSVPALTSSPDARALVTHDATTSAARKSEQPSRRAALAAVIAMGVLASGSIALLVGPLQSCSPRTAAGPMPVSSASSPAAAEATAPPSDADLPPRSSADGREPPAPQPSASADVDAGAPPSASVPSGTPAAPSPTTSASAAPPAPSTVIRRVCGKEMDIHGNRKCYDVRVPAP